MSMDSTKKQCRWLKTVLRVVSGNLCDGVCFKLDKQTWWEKSNGTHKTISQNICIKICDIWQNFYFYCILNNENFKMEVERTNFVTHLIILLQYHYIIDYLKIPTVKRGSQWG